jgi:hypothetical protein
LCLFKLCAAGDVGQFASLTELHAAAIATQPALVHRASVVREKLTLLALVRLVCETSSHERTLPFEDIASRLHAAAWTRWSGW